MTNYKITAESPRCCNTDNIDEKQLASICVEMAGGGYTPEQVANAMTIQDTLITAGEYTLKSGVVIKLEVLE